jgi:mannose-1-phosphate guanylyltransferase
MKTCAVVLCGGVGERLWPYSTPEIPKQFQIFFQGKSLLDLTLERIRKIEPDKILLVTNERYREHINSIYGDQIAKNLIDVLYEPSAKGTSSSILYATLYLDRIIGESYKVCILPADHYFDDSFAPFLKEAMILNNNDRHLITTFGISPTNPDTGFGYIKHESGAITSFHEKPSLSRANELILDGALWNSGIFIFYTRHMVSIYNHLYPIQVDLMTKWLENVDVYDQLENISFDYAIMEKIDCGRVLNFPSVWNDVGDWNRISTLIESDKHVAVNSRNTFVKSDRPVIVIGLSDIIVTSTSDGILIASRSHLDSVKHALSIFKISHNEL